MSATMTRPKPAGPSSKEPARRVGWLIRVLVVVVVGFGVFAALALGSVVSAARTDDRTPTDAIVVLGASQYWGEPSPVFANRLDRARELYEAGVAPRIVTVGGGIPGDKTTEAQAGRDYLVRSGVPEAAVVTVTSGSDTITSLEAVGRRAAKRGWRSVTLVSDRAHLARSRAIAEVVGFDDVRVSGPVAGDGSLLTFDYAIREASGLFKFYLWDRWTITSGRSAPNRK